MSAWINMLRGGLVLDTATFLQLRERRDAVMRGFLFIVVIALLAGFPAFVLSFARGAQAHPLSEAETGQVMAELQQALDQMSPVLGGLPPGLTDAIRENVRIGVSIAQQIQQLPRPLPLALGEMLQAIGAWLSVPFARGLVPLGLASLATWLGYGTWVLLAGRLLGGRGSMVPFFGATSLYAAPHLLNVFGFLPVLGPITYIVAFLWGLVIYVKATAVSHEIGLGRALLAVLLPALILIGLVVLVLIVLIGLAIATGANS